MALLQKPRSRERLKSAIGLDNDHRPIGGHHINADQGSDQWL